MQLLMPNSTIDDNNRNIFLFKIEDFYLFESNIKNLGANCLNQ